MTLLHAEVKSNCCKEYMKPNRVTLLQISKNVESILQLKLPPRPPPPPPALASIPINNWRILLEQSFTACMPLLAASKKMPEFSSMVLDAASPYHQLYS